MKTEYALGALAALAHETRLAAYRLLVEAGPEGLAVGTIGARLGLAPATLSFHLAHLRRAGLIRSRRAGRTLYQEADFAAMNDLIAYLTDNCCAGGVLACFPAPADETVRETREHAPRRLRSR